MSKTLPLLEIKNLSIVPQNDESKLLCDNVSFRVNENQIIGVVGESGSGKTLTALSLLGLLAPGLKVIGGDIVLHKGNTQISLLSLSPHELLNVRGHQIGMIFQEPMTSLNPSMTCGNQVMEAILTHEKLSESQARDKVFNLFEKVRLPNPEGIFKSYPHQLSGGQRQRVMIAMAVSCNPRLLIADEPTTALDVTVQKSIFALLRELQSEFQMSIIFISHDLGIISELADEVVVMYKGKVVETGKTSDILNQPQHPYTKALLACRPSQYNKGKRLITIQDTTGELSHEDRQPVSKESGILLEVKNLSVYFSSHGKSNFLSRKKSQALFDLSFEVFTGETLGLVGESGSGKTTLSRAVLRLIESKSDQIRYKNVDLGKLKGEALRKFRKNIQIIFQYPYSSINPKETIGSIIMEPMIVHNLNGGYKQKKEKVLEILDKVQLNSDMYHRYPHQLSGGQRQRVGIARALAVEPELIICDESVSALDVSIQAQVLNLLNDLKRDFGLTYIFISHDLNVVRYMSDRIIVLKSGKIEEKGNPDDIFTNPSSGYTRELIAAIPGKGKIGI
ncbi:MAG: ABC transporter ATP-binding protein [Bacteroidales bacterium]|nr:ABC transporter ATP-binding protein [Bacteroidales bacterium]